MTRKHNKMPALNYVTTHWPTINVHHGVYPDLQTMKIALNKFILEKWKKGEEEVVINHGRGVHGDPNGIRLRDIVKEELSNNPLVDGVRLAMQGAEGLTIAILKKKRITSMCGGTAGTSVIPWSSRIGQKVVAYRKDSSEADYGTVMDVQKLDNGSKRVTVRFEDRVVIAYKIRKA